MNTKPNIVLDIDNTILFCHTACDKSEINKYMNTNKIALYFTLMYNNKPCYHFAEFRPCFKQFLDYIDKRFNIYIYSNGIESYVTIISKIIELKFNIKLRGVMGRSKYNNSKQLINLNLNRQNTLIIDDIPTVWDKNDREVVIQIGKFNGTIDNGKKTDTQLLEMINIIDKIYKYIKINRLLRYIYIRNFYIK